MYNKSKMAKMAAILKKMKNRHISATDWPIGIKFFMVMHMNRLKHTDS